MQQTIDTQKKLAAQLQVQLQSMTDKAELLKMEQNKRQELETEIQQLKEKNAKVISSCHVYRNLIKQLTEQHIKLQQKLQANAESKAEKISNKSYENREVAEKPSHQSNHSEQQEVKQQTTSLKPAKQNSSYAALFKKRKL